MIDQTLIDAYIEVEEICLGRDLTELEKAQTIEKQISAEFKQIISLKNLPDNSLMELYYVDFMAFKKALKQDYDFIQFGKFAVLFIYRLTSERAYLYSNNGWKLGFNVPVKGV